jgi:phosphoribosylanthranilate isomerase
MKTGRGGGVNALDCGMAVEIKMCGLTCVGDAREALAAGADYLGFVLYPESPRGITPARLCDVLGRLDRPCRAVAVCVNMPRAEVERVAAEAGLYAVQLHGDEPPGAFSDFPVPVWRALRVEASGPRPDPAAWPAARYVIDASVPGQYGGTGTPADWDRAAAVAAAVPAMLAGGLTAENVAQAIRRVRPLGVDVSSGVEAGPGRKDRDMMRAFVRNAVACD